MISYFFREFRFKRLGFLGLFCISLLSTQMIFADTIPLKDLTKPRQDELLIFRLPREDGEGWNRMAFVGASGYIVVEDLDFPSYTTHEILQMGSAIHGQDFLSTPQLVERGHFEGQSYKLHQDGLAAFDRALREKRVGYRISSSDFLAKSTRSRSFEVDAPLSWKTRMGQARSRFVWISLPQVLFSVLPTKHILFKSGPELQAALIQNTGLFSLAFFGALGLTKTVEWAIPSVKASKHRDDVQKLISVVSTLACGAILKAIASH